MTGSEIAAMLIRHFEGLRLSPYIFEGESAFSIGYGHQLPNGDIHKTITVQEAEELLQNDLASRNADLKEQLGTQYGLLTPGQLGATLSFKYNCKPVLFDNSTFLSLLRQGNFSKAQAEFKRWIYGEGHIPLPGLVRRRRCEAYVFGGGTIEQLISFNWFL